MAKVTDLLRELLARAGGLSQENRAEFSQAIDDFEKILPADLPETRTES